MKISGYLISAVITGGGMIFFQLSNFLLGIFIVRYISVQELGHYQFFVVTATFMSYFAKMGGDEKISYILPAIGGAGSSEGRALMTHVLIRTIMLSVLVVLLYALFDYVISGRQWQQKKMIDALAYSLYLPSFVGGLILTSILRAEHRMLGRSLFIYILPNIFNFIFIVVISAWLFSESSSILARSVSYLLLFILLFLLLHRRYGFAINKENKMDKKVYSGNLGWLMVTIVSFALESGLLVIWAGKLFLDDYENGVLAILLRLSALMLLVPTAINIVMGPVLAREPHNILLRKKIFLLNIFGVLFVFLALFLLSDFLLSFFGREYVKYSVELLIFITAWTFLALSQPLYSVFMALNLKKFVYLFGWFMIFVFIALLIFIGRYNLNTIAGIVLVIFFLLSVGRLFYYLRILLDSSN